MNEQTLKLQTAVAAVAAVGFALAAEGVGVTWPPGARELAAADPLIVALTPSPGLHTITIAAIVVAAGWWVSQLPSAADWKQGARAAALGAGAAALAAFAIRFGWGPTLPDFIPSEESSATGLYYGLSAGVFEEVLFRLVLLPGVFLLLRKAHLGPMPAAALAIIISGFAFALSHEIGPQAFNADYFATRVVVPGALMSLAYFAAGPVFIISAHCTAHFFIAALFA